MFKMFSQNNNTVYYDKLDTRHTSIKMTPVKTSKKENEEQLYSNLYGDLIYLKPRKAKIKIGDIVRILQYKRPYLIKDILQIEQKRCFC